MCRINGTYPLRLHSYPLELFNCDELWKLYQQTFQRRTRVAELIGKRTLREKGGQPCEGKVSTTDITSSTDFPALSMIADLVTDTTSFSSKDTNPFKRTRCDSVVNFLSLLSRRGHKLIKRMTSCANSVLWHEPRTQFRVILDPLDL